MTRRLAARAQAAACRVACRARGAFALVLVAGLAGCGASLLPKPAPPPAMYALEDRPVAPAQPPSQAVGARTLLVSLPQAAAGYDTRLIAFQRQAQRIEYFADSVWVDAPARMLAPLIARGIEGTGAFRAVLRGPSSAAADWRLDTELVRLSHDFSVSPSQVHLALRAVLWDLQSRRVLATQDFAASAPSSSEEAAGGVAAAQQAAQTVASRLAAFCAAATRSSLP